jgi:hypothetical protein
MVNVTTQFQGQTLILPGAYSYVSVAGTLASVNAAVPPVIFICNSYGGAPYSAVTFANAQAAVPYLRGAPSAVYLQALYTPSSQVNGASLVTVINAAQNTQSALTISDATPTAVMTFTSANYGLPSNLLQMDIVAGNIGGVTITLFDGYAGTSVVGTNLGIPMQIAYLGSGTVNYTVTSTALTITSSNAAESLSVLFSSYQTVAQAVAYISGTGYYDAVVVSNAQLPLRSLDLASAITLPPPTSGVPNFVNVTATLTDIQFWATQFASAYVTTPTIPGGITSIPANAPVPIPYTHFTGGTNVPPTNSNYASALNAALNTPGWIVFVDSNAPAVQALASQHVTTASSIPYRSWRRYFTGSSVGDSISTTVTAATDLNSSLCSYFYPGLQVTNTTTGLNTTYGGLFVAACAAGMAAGNPVAMPLTNKTVTGNGVEVVLNTSQILTLISSGVFVLYLPQDTNVPTFAQDLTTWQVNNNSSLLYNQQVSIDQFLSYVLFQTGQPYVGTIASTFDQTNILKAYKALLNGLINSSTNSNGILNSWDSSSLTITYNSAQQLQAISVNVVPVGQNIYITVTANVQPLNLTIQG